MKLEKLAAKLVSFDTESKKSTVDMADFICGYLEGCGFVIERYPYWDKINKVEKVNVIARKGGQESKLVYSGHMDTVPSGPGWNTEAPLSLIEKSYEKIGEVFQGLGIADMKFFLAVAMKAGEAISTAELKHPFALCFTSDEEVGCIGARKLRDAVKQQGRTIGEYVVVGEPTEFKPVYSHKGYISLEVIVGAFEKESGVSREAGNPCHSSDPSTTTNAVGKALGPVIEELCKFRERLEKVHDFRFKPPFATMNVGGDILMGRIIKKKKEKKDSASEDNYEYIPDKFAKNIIPRGFRIYSDIRPLPGQDPRDLVEIIESNIKERISSIKTTVTNEKFYVKVGCPKGISVSHPMATSKDSLLLKTIEEISGFPVGTAAYNTEGGIFNRAGSESVVWGPSNILQAHKDNEYVLAELFKEETVEKYIQLIRRMCT